jgi:hypothetical protein
VRLHRLGPEALSDLLAVTIAAASTLEDELSLLVGLVGARTGDPAAGLLHGMGNLGDADTATARAPRPGGGRRQPEAAGHADDADPERRACRRGAGTHRHRTLQATGTPPVAIRTLMAQGTAKDVSNAVLAFFRGIAFAGNGVEAL